MPEATDSNPPVWASAREFDQNGWITIFPLVSCFRRAQSFSYNSGVAPAFPRKVE